MQRLLNNLTIAISDAVYLKDPETSDLGRRIVTGSIDLLDAIGLEQFTFRKLGKSIGSTEASIYRYFENKHKLLLYLVIWYWGWMEYRLVFRTANIEEPEDRLRRALQLLTEQVTEDSSFSHINEVKLNRIVVAESLKAFLTREVEADNRAGAFTYYKRIVERITEIIREINPQFAYPHMLVSTVVEGAHLQRHFAEHLPGLTDPGKPGGVTEFFTDLTFKTIR